MESDREATNLGAEDTAEIQSEVPSASKQPKRRFIGRRAAAERAAAAGSSNTSSNNGSIEDSNAVQGNKNIQPVSYDSA